VPSRYPAAVIPVEVLAIKCRVVLTPVYEPASDRTAVIGMRILENRRCVVDRLLAAAQIVVMITFQTAPPVVVATIVLRRFNIDFLVHILPDISDIQLACLAVRN